MVKYFSGQSVSLLRLELEFFVIEIENITGCAILLGSF